MGISLLSVFIAVLIHEMGHYLSALYYGLNPHFSISLNAVSIQTDFLNARTHQIVSHVGPIFNLVIALIVLVFLFVRWQKYSIRDDVCFILFLTIATNLMVALVSLILFPFTGIL